MVEQRSPKPLMRVRFLQPLPRELAKGFEPHYKGLNPFFGLDKSVSAKFVLIPLVLLFLADISL